MLRAINFCVRKYSIGKSGKTSKRPFLLFLTGITIIFTSCEKKEEKSLDATQAKVSITNGGDTDYYVQFSQDVSGLQIGVLYTITFDAYASRDVEIMCDVNQGSEPYQQVLAMGGISPYFSITTSKATYSKSVISTIDDEGDGISMLTFNLGNIGVYDIYFDNVSVTADSDELLINGDFSSAITTGWNDLFLYGTTEATVSIIAS